MAFAKWTYISGTICYEKYGTRLNAESFMDQLDSRVETTCNADANNTTCPKRRSCSKPSNPAGSPSLPNRSVRRAELGWSDLVCNRISISLNAFQSLCRQDFCSSNHCSDQNEKFSTSSSATPRHCLPSALPKRSRRGGSSKKTTRTTEKSRSSYWLSSSVRRTCFFWVTRLSSLVSARTQGEGLPIPSVDALALAWAHAIFSAM